MHRFVPLGDQALLASFPDEHSALHFASAVRRLNPSWLIDLVQAYATVAVYFDLTAVNYETAIDGLNCLDLQTQNSIEEGRLHLIPCCYDRGLDLKRIAEQMDLSVEEVIEQHSGVEYTVYAIGFCPGFPYLGYLPLTLCGVPRLASPRLRVEAGSVGLTGRQTGIYTEERPGGWSLVGQTPFQMVDVRDGYFPLRTGDRVRFQPISEAEFQRRQGERLLGA